MNTHWKNFGGYRFDLCAVLAYRVSSTFIEIHLPSGAIHISGTMAEMQGWLTILDEGFKPVTH